MVTTVTATEIITYGSYTVNPVLSRASIKEALTSPVELKNECMKKSQKCWCIFEARKVKIYPFGKVSPTSLESTIHSTYLRKTVRQFWCKSLCFSCQIHSFKFLHASFSYHKRCGLCPLCFQTGMLLLWHIAYIGKAQRFCSVVFLLPNEIFVLKVPPLLYYLAPL